jgi:hypothetical protein
MSAEDYPSAEQQREWREKKAYFDKKKWNDIKEQFGLRELGWNGGLVHWEGRRLEGWYGIKNKVYRLKGTREWKPGLLRDLKKLFQVKEEKTKENTMSNSVWQLCPKCNGNKYNSLHTVFANGIISKEPCNICEGTGLISILTGLPPKKPTPTDEPEEDVL